MGYDVSFHPISPDEIQEWYFTPLTWIQQGQEEKVLPLPRSMEWRISMRKNIWIPCGSGPEQSLMNCLTKATAFTLR